MDNTVASRRKDLGMTQQQLAESVRISRQSIISIERGRFDPTLKVALRLAHTLGCTIEELFTPSTTTGGSPADPADDPPLK